MPAMYNYYHCHYHQDRSPVVQCTRCGNFLCEECASKIVPNEKGEILCPDCQKAMAPEVKKEKKTDSRVGQLEEQKSELISRAILCFIGLLTGATMYLFGGTQEFKIFGAIIWALGGISTAWAFLEKTRSDPVVDAVYSVKYPGTGILSTLLRLTAAAVIALLAAPILFIINLAKIAGINRDIKELEAE